MRQPDGARSEAGRSGDAAAPPGVPEGRSEARAGAAPMSRVAVAGVVLVATLAVLWFVVSWLVFNSPVLDALSEAAGGILVLLILVSLIGAVCRSSPR